VELAPGCSITEVESWLAAGDTQRLASFFWKRHEVRFLAPIECLRKAAETYSGYGFSMMSLCCLLIETVQCYRDGMPTSSRKEWGLLVDIQSTEPVPPEYFLPTVLPKTGRAVFEKFFFDFQSDFPMAGQDFYENIRNGLLHQAQTKSGWTIDAKGSVPCDPLNKRINRDLFVQKLRICINNYFQVLRCASWGDANWTNAAKKMWWLIRVSK
jgi:hypothetical protein